MCLVLQGVYPRPPGRTSQDLTSKTSGKYVRTYFIYKCLVGGTQVHIRNLMNEITRVLSFRVTICQTESNPRNRR